jgi:hypothetical protein
MPIPTIELSVEAIRFTDLAVLVNDGDREAWIPLSQISEDTKPDEPGYCTIEIPEWLAQDKGLV